MREIAAFLSEDEAASLMFEGAAQFYDRLATDVANEGLERATLDKFFRANKIPEIRPVDQTTGWKPTPYI